MTDIVKRINGNYLTADKVKSISRYRLLVALTVVSAFVNLLFYDNMIIGYGLAILQSGLLLYLLFIKKDLMSFFCCYIIILASCIEFSVFASNAEDVAVYNFKFLKIFGLNMGLIFIFLAAVVILIANNGVLLKKPDRLPQECKLFAIGTLGLLLVALFTGVINILVNDNNIRNLENFLSAFINNAYQMTWLLLVLFVALNIFSRYHGTDRMNELGKLLIVVIMLNAVVPLILAFMGISGSYGTKKMLLSNLITFYTPLLLLLPLYKKTKKNVLFAVIIGAFIILATTFFNYASGKTILLIGLVIFLFWIFSFKKNKATFLIFTVVAVSAIIIFLPIAINMSPLFAEKFKEVMSLIQFWRPNWYENMEPSSKFRITELISIFSEYIKKPQYFLFGKGFLGTMLDVTGNFYPNGWTTGGFTYPEFLNGTYYTVHESFAVLLLRNGLVGIAFFGFFVYKVIRNIRDNIFVIIGGVWFVFYFDWSLTIGIIGVTCLLYGFYLANVHKKAKRMRRLSNVQSLEADGMRKNI